MKATPSYIKESKDFIKLLDNLTLPHNTLLVTIDVTGLYTHILKESKHAYKHLKIYIFHTNHLKMY